MAFGLGDLGFPTSLGDFGTSLMNPIGATMTDPFSGATTKMGYINPNSTPEGAALRAQMGDTITWGSLADRANQLMGQQTYAPQVERQPFYQALTTKMNAEQGQALQGQAMGGTAAQAQGASLDMAQANQIREGQNALVSSLQGTAAGQGPSIAQEQLRQATNANIAQQASSAQSAHGAARLAALRNASQQQAQIQQQANSQAAGLRAQEIAAAQSGLGNALGMTRGQDIGAATTAAQLAQQSGQFNAANQQAMNLANMAAGNQMAQANLGYGNQMALANLGYTNTANQFNAAARNLSSLNFAQQANQGNQAYGLADLTSRQNTNLLNFQQNQEILKAMQAAAKGQTDIATTGYEGTADYNQFKAKQINEGLKMGGDMLNQGGGAMSFLGMLGI